MISSVIPPATQHNDTEIQRSAPHLSITVQRINYQETQFSSGPDSAIASPGIEDRTWIQVLTRDHAARPNSDELSLPAGTVVRVLTNPDDSDEPGQPWVLVTPVQGAGEKGYVPRHLLADPASVMAPLTPSNTRPKSSPSSPRHKAAHRVSYEETRGRKPYLTPNLKSQKLSTHLLKSNEYYHRYSRQQPTSASASAVPAGVHITVHGADRVPTPVIPPGLPHGSTLQSTTFRLALVHSSHAISSNVHSAKALSENKGKSQGCKWTVSQPDHTPITSGSSLFSSDGKYDENKLFARIDPDAFDAALLVELVYTFRMPGVSDTDKARLRHVSAGWAVLNLFTSPGSLVAFRKYTLTVRNKSPAHLDATELKVNATEARSSSSVKPATITVSLAALETKWLPAVHHLPSPLLSSLSSLPLLLSIHHAWRLASDLARSESGSPKQPPIADPLISWAASAIDVPSSLPVLASVWRAERKKLAVHERRDVQVATKMLRRVAAAWCAGVDGVVTLENKAVMLKQCTSLGNSMQALIKVPNPTAMASADGVDLIFKPFRTSEVKVWSH